MRYFRLTKRFLATGSIAVVLSISALAQSGATWEQLKYAAGMPETEIVWGNSGIPTSIRGGNLEEAACGGRGVALGKPGEYTANAVAVMDRLAGLFRIDNAADEFRAKRVQGDNLGLQHVRLRQKYQDLKVVGGKMLVHFDPQGRAYQVNGQYIPDINIPVTPALSAADAARAAADHWTEVKRPAGAQLQGTPELVIYALDGTPLLAYELIMAHPIPIRGVWQYYVDALTGEIITSISQVRGTQVKLNGHLLLNEGGAKAAVTGTLEDGLYYMGNDRYFIFNADRSGSYPDSGEVANRATPEWGTATHPDRIQFSAANNMEACLTFWQNVLGRNSFDNRGTSVRVEVLDDTDENNAYWYNGTITFVIITDDSMTDLAVMDVLGHEFGHGVNESVAGFIYRNEPGAIDESFADIFGNSLEFHWQPDGRGTYPAKPAPGTASWFVGEDGMGTPYPALRDMRNPMNPAVMAPSPSRYWGTHWHDYIANPNFDYGGVHFNNGVQNFMYYLLSDGGTGVNDSVIAYEVAGIGISNAVKVAYQSLNYMNPYSTFSSAVVSWISAAQDINADWVDNVKAAWAAVGLSSTPAPGVGPAIKANGQTGYATVQYPGTVELKVELNPGSYQAEVDWWLVAQDKTRNQWFYFDELYGWTGFSGNLTQCRPAYQGALFNLPPYTVLPARRLDPGEYTVWFGVSFPSTGILDTTNPDLHYQSVDIKVLNLNQ